MVDSREHILATSLNLFLQKNFKEVTMNDIVAKTGLSKGGFYHYFSSKEQVFREVIQHFFTEFINVDFSVFDQSSLLGFYTDCLKATGGRIKSINRMAENDTEVVTANLYFLIFDAMKMMPSFKQQHFEQQKEELRAWTRIIKVARVNKEIKSALTDEQVAKLFVYAGDGVGINFIMADNMTKTYKEIKIVWDGLYSMLKV